MKKRNKSNRSNELESNEQLGDLTTLHDQPSWPWLLLGFLGTAAWTLAVQDDPFFWDAIQLGSKHAHHFYENNLRWTVLPTAIDSGHPPVFGYYIAVVWTLFGKSLALSHWAMFPFLAGIALLLFRLGLRLGGQPCWAAAFVVLVCADPVLAGQSVSVGPDIPLVFFFLLAVEAFWGGRRILAMIAIVGLCSISMRGMMTAGALFLWQICLFRPIIHPKMLLRLSQTTLTFLPGVAFAMWFLWWHQQAAGWTGFHADSPWASAFEPSHGIALVKNLLVIGWRWVDFGRLFEWVAIALVMVALAQQRARQNSLKTRDLLGTIWAQLTQGHKEWRALILLLICLVVFLSPSALLYSNLSAHRYFLPGFLALHLLFFHLLCSIDWSRSRKIALFVLLLLGLGTGNRWIYPHGVAMGWDATLAHRPYHALRAEMMRFIDRENIPLEAIGTAFPNINTGENLMLDGDQRSFAEKDFSKNRFVLVSNIFNDFSSAEYHHLKQEWMLLKRCESWGLWLELYQNGSIN